MAFLKSSFLVVVAIIALSNQVDARCPQIVGRSEWQSRSGIRHHEFPNPPRNVIIHHSLTPTCMRERDCSAAVKALQKHQMDNLEKPDIGSNFLIGEDGNVYEGTGWKNVAQHTAHAYNRNSIGVTFIGEYSSHLPSREALDALRALLECGVQGGHLPADYKLLADRQVRSTESPGHKLFFELRRWPNWSAAP